MRIPEESLERLVVLRRELDRIFRDFFDPDRPEVMPEGSAPEILLDVWETDDEILMEMELPGMEREQIDLSVLRDIVVIEGQKPRPPVPEGANYHCLERSFGRFRRVVEIPSAGDTRAIQARFADGVLIIRLPKIKERRGGRQKVPIS